jgi:hypothetical protein
MYGYVESGHYTQGRESMIANITLSALAALVFKLGLLAYSTRSRVKNATTRLFLVLLVMLSLHNLVEFVGLNYYVLNGLTPTMQAFGIAYVALLIPAIALILHISLRLSLDWPVTDLRVRLQPLLYVPALILLALLLLTDQLVIGFQRFQNTLLRQPGPLYFLFETYLVVYLSAALVNLVYGARRSRPFSMRRTRNRLWLLAIAPVVLLLVYLIVANHFGWTKLTSTIYMPALLTFFLAVTTYATHQYRLFDIEYFFPWSKVRARQTVFHRRMQQMIADLVGSRNVNGAGRLTIQRTLQALSDVLRCPVVFVGGPHPVPLMAGEALGLARFPVEELKNINRFVVADEVAEAMPATYQLMRRHKIAAIVPFHPHSHTANGWMLLGESFIDEVKTPFDFRLVENLFDVLADRFLDANERQARQIADLTDERHRLVKRLAQAWHSLATERQSVVLLQREVSTLKQELALATARFKRDVRAAKRETDLLLDTSQELARAAFAVAPPITDESSLDECVQAYEVQVILAAIEKCGGNKSRAARILGLRPNTMHYKLKRAGISLPRQTKRNTRESSNEKQKDAD